MAKEDALSSIVVSEDAEAAAIYAKFHFVPTYLLAKVKALESGGQEESPEIENYRG